MTARSPARPRAGPPRAAARLAAALFVLAGLRAAAAATPYETVGRALADLDERLPGGTNFARAVGVVEGVLRGAGLEPRRQTFATVVPRTIRCELTADGRPVGPLYPLGPNGVALTTTGDETWSGPLLWLGDGTPGEMDGREIEGAIALLNLRSRRMAEVFAQGARAVIFVDDGEATQWDAARHFTEMTVSRPRFCLPRAAAAAAGLLDPAAARAGTVRCATAWADVEGVNLWAEIPGDPEARFYLDAGEILVLAARLDTFGIVPDVCPDRRRAANAALLAEVACRLARERPKRTVLVVFLGAHYGAQEGARQFYYAVGKAERGGWNVDPLDFREKRYREERKGVTAQIELLGEPDFLRRRRHPEWFRVRQLVGRDLEARVNDLNYEMRERTLAAAAAGAEPAAVDRALEGIRERKTVWNEFRRQLNRLAVDPDDPDWRRLLDDVRGGLEARRDELDAQIRHNRSAMDLAERVAGRTVVAHFGFDFADDERDWIFSMLGDVRIARAETVYPGSYGLNLASLQTVFDRALGADRRPGPVPDALRASYPPYSLCLPAERLLPAAAAGSFGIPAYEMMTAGDPLAGDELPRATEADVAGLADALSRFFAEAARAPELSQRPVLKAVKFESNYTYWLVGGDRYQGDRFVDFARGSGDVGGPSPAALACSDSGGINVLPAVAGHSRIGYARVNRAGYFFLPGAREGIGRRVAFGFDATGRLERFPYRTGREGESGRLFHGFGGGLFVPYQPRLHSAFGSAYTAVLNGLNDSAEKYQYREESGRQTVFYVGREVPLKYIGANGVTLLGATKERPMGGGVPIGPADLDRLDVTRRSALDYALLNQERLEALRRRHIVNASIEALHAEARDHIERAGEARAERQIARAAAHEVFAFSLGLRAFEPLKGVTNDLVRAVVYLMILSIPFAFAMERLLFGFTSIYRQVAGFAGLFIATFLLLFFVHPAFALAAAPVIIFLAFVIILLSSIVIYLVMSRFKQELRALQGLASKAHGAAADSGAAGAAVLIGITGLRKRPVKTLLTAVTVVLLTFTILAFASFTSELDVVETYLGRGEGEDRIEAHRFSFLELPAAFADALDRLYGDAFRVCRRNAIFMDPTSVLRDHVPAPVVYCPARRRAVELGAVLGLQAAETEANASLRAILPGPAAAAAGDLPPLFLPDSAAAHLGAKPGDELRLFGSPFRFAGLTDTARLRDAANLDGSRVLPPDFEATITEQNADVRQAQAKNEQQLETIDTHSFVWSSPDRVAVAPYDALERLGAVLNVVALYPRDGADVEGAARTIARVFDGPLVAKGAGGARQYFFTRAVEGSGLREIIVPLLLGGLIIFSSLMGSIVDREREIFTYSALGLAPRDVGVLFLAESAVYAVVGGMGGYLVSQVVAKVLYAMAARGWVQPPEMNFSSLTAVLTILVVMATVMLSALYPAFKAGRSANPGVARQWRMPPPTGDALTFVFPFTVSEADLAGILSFVGEHFENHGDATLGNFAAREVRVFRRDAGGRGLGISALVSLAPFDLGVFQDFRMYSKPSEIEGIDEVVVELRRRSGAPASWVRGNRDFIAELRQQFLLWRSLPVETCEHYRRRTEDLLKTA